MEHRRHLGLAVDALLAQHRDARARAARDEGRSDVLARIEGQIDDEGWRIERGRRRELLACAPGIITQLAHAERGLGPLALERFPGLVDARAAGVETDAVRADERTADDGAAALYALGIEHTEHMRGVHRTDLQHHARLLGEERGEAIPFRAREVHLESAVAGEGHLEQRHRETAIRAVVVGEHPALVTQMHERCGESLEQRRLVEIGRLHTRRAAEQAAGLRQHRTAEAIAPTREVDQHQHGVARVGAQLRGP